MYLEDLNRKKDQAISLHVQFDQIACNGGDKALWIFLHDLNFS